ncbi:HK97 family phage prohead protease [Streptosporangium sp. NPDC051023]|uniref:HK97 family phage prohead protease n=1 Tax=Streptosporangium sp. NPDC051023 TaxID=3155410 RepID=UPI00344BC52F
MRLEFKAATAPAGAELLEADDETGVVEAIVSVTGIVDSDDDIITPGVYAESLARRRPKGLFAHDWKQWASRTENIEEWLPGDPRLPKTTRNGRPWPTEAGGLYVRTRYNLDTTSGRDAYHHVKFYSQSGECEWSIGYRVPKGKGVRGKDGVRRITGIDLFEYSPVLFGANSETGTLSFKAAEISEGDEGDYEPITAKCADGVDRTPAGGSDPGGDAAEGEEQDDPSNADVPLDGPPAQEPVDDAELRAAAEQLDEAELAEGAAHAPAMADEDVAEGEQADAPSSSSTGATEEEEASTEEEEDAQGDAPDQGGAKDGAPGVADTPADAAAVARLKRWYARGEGAVKIGWGTAGDWERCVRLAGEHMSPDKAKGFCSNIHRQVTGEWPGPQAHGGKAQEMVESARYPYLPGSYEERRDTLREMAAKLLDVPVTHAEVVATWPDRIVVTALTDTGQGAKSFELPYTAGASGTLLVGQPVPVEVSVRVEGEVGAPLPYAAMIEEAAQGIKTLLAHGEAKAGRVLSTANARRLVHAVEQIVFVLKAAGLPVNDNPEVEEEADAVAAPSESTAPSARGESAKAAGVVVGEDLQARIAAILADAQAVRV